MKFCKFCKMNNDDIIEIKLTKKQINETLKAGFRSAISDHKNITKNNYSSVQKRILANLLYYALENNIESIK